MSRRLVLVDDAGASHPVYNRYSASVSRLRRCLVAGFDGLDDLFDAGTQQRAATCVVLTSLFGLSSPLFCLRRVGQCSAPE